MIEEVDLAWILQPRFVLTNKLASSRDSDSSIYRDKSNMFTGVTSSIIGLLEFRALDFSTDRRLEEQWETERRPHV